TGLMATWLVELDFLQGIGGGAMVGATEAAAVFAVLKGRSLNERGGSTVEMEWGPNVALGVVLRVTLCGILCRSGAGLGAG
ncbi:K+/H+ antiporter, partial [Vibrio parahaemolyticus]|nr:K+/H+ antiporter [Vibrio parahaemolyticus]